MVPPLCANGCGFYGNPATQNFCSKCYNDEILMQSIGSHHSDLTHEMKSVSTEEAKEVVVVERESKGGESRKERAGRCRFGLCKKRVWLIGFSCRCGGTFCSVHRFPDQHDCSFNFKKFGQDAIARENPVIKPDKLERIN